MLHLYAPMRKLFFSLLACLVLTFLIPIQSFAQANTETSYNVTYSVNQTGMTHANFAVSLKNTTSDMYVSSYSLQVRFTNIQNAQASDGKTITPTVKQNKDG